MDREPVISIILLFCGERTGNFGAGSHINNLIPGFKNNPYFSLYVIKTDDKQASSIYEEFDNEIGYLHIPQPENKLYLSPSSTLIQITYASRLVEIIYPFIKEKNNPFFLINSIDYFNIGCELKSKLSCKLVYVHHSWTWKYFHNIQDEEFSILLKRGNYNGIEKAVYFTSIQQKMALLADKVITVSYQARNFFINALNINPEKLSTIYNGIVPPSKQTNSKVNIKKKLGIRKSEKVILFSGRLKEDKGLVYLIKAFYEVNKKYPNCRLVMAGSGDFKLFTPYSNVISSKITYTGKLKQEDLEEWYSIADLGILPSLHEQCSFTAIEMRFFKIPLIVSSVDGLDEMFSHNFDSLKLTVKFNEKGHRTLDYKEVANHIFTLLENKELTQKLTDNGYKVAFKNFTAAEMQAKYVKVFMSESNK